MFAGDHDQHVVAQADVLAVEQQAAAVEFCFALLEVLGVAVHVMAVHVFDHVDAVACEQIDNVLKEDNSGFIVVEAIIDDQVVGLWLCGAFEVCNAFRAGLVDLMGLNAGIGEQAFFVDIQTCNLCVGKVVPPDPQGRAGFAVLAHVGEAAGVIGADAAFQNIGDLVAAVVENHAVEVGVGVWLPIELAGFGRVGAFVAAIHVAELRQIAVFCRGVERFNMLT